LNNQALLKASQRIQGRAMIRAGELRLLSACMTSNMDKPDNLYHLF
jgi:hypothetical protein